MKTLLLFVLLLPAFSIYGQMRPQSREEEIAKLTEIIKSDPTNINAYANRATAEWSLKEDSLAIEDYQAAIRLDKKRAWIYYNDIGLIKMNANDFSSAIESYTKAVNQKEESGIYGNRARAKFFAKDYNSAITDYTIAIEKTTKETRIKHMFNTDLVLSNYYVDRAEANVFVKGRQAALTDYNQAITIYPHNGRAYNGRGDLKNELGDKVAACSDWNNAVNFGYKPAGENLDKFCN